MPGQSVIAARVAWGVQGIVLTEPCEEANATIEALGVSQSGNDAWDPTQAGLPSDITEDLDTPATEVRAILDTLPIEIFFGAPVSTETRPSYYFLLPMDHSRTVQALSQIAYERKSRVQLYHK